MNASKRLSTADGLKIHNRIFSNDYKASLVDCIKRRHPMIRKDANVGVRSGYMPSEMAIVTNDPRNLLVMANTAAIDEDNEVVVPDGAMLDYFGQNRMVFFDHEYKNKDMAGGVRRGWPKLTPEGWKVQFHVRRSADGDQLLKDAEDYGVSVSIGFDALEHGPPTDEEIAKYGGGKSFRSIVRKWRWIELSVTWMPCNVSARSAHPVSVAPKKRGTLTPFGVISAPHLVLP